MSKSENIALYKYLTRPAGPEIKTREKFAKGTTIGSQLPLEEYITIVKEMVNDRNYVPPVNLNAREVGRIPNFEKAKEIVKAEMGDGFTQAYQANVTRRKKLKQKVIRESDPEKKIEYLAKKAERRRTRRVEKIGKDIQLTPKEKYLNFQQSLVAKQLNETIRKNPDLILKNKNLMDQLSTTVDKNGNIIKVKPSLVDIKNRGIFEIEHQRDIYKKGKMKDFPYNRNLILGPYNRTGGFKESAEKFIEKNPDPLNPKVQMILNKADELGVTIQPNVPEGIFSTKALGYKQTPDPVIKFVDVAKKVMPEIARNDLGIASYKGDIGMAKRALGVKQLAAEAIPGSRYASEFLQGFADDVMSKSYGKAALKGLGLAGAAYGVYDTGVALKEGKSIPETAARFFALDVPYQKLRQYNRLTDEEQEIQKRVNQQRSFDAASQDILDEGLVTMRPRPEIAEEDLIKLEQGKQRVDAAVEAEESERAASRKGLVETVKQKIYEVTGTPYELYMNRGGRVQLSEGGKPKDLGRRKFIKGAVTIAAALPFLKFIKPLSKTVEPTIEAISRSAHQMPDYLTNLINKIKMMGESKIIGKMDSPDEFMRYDLGDYELYEGAGGSRLKRVRDRGEYGYEEFEMQIKQDPETGYVEYEEVSVRPDEDGKLKDVDFGIDDDVHAEMKKFADED